MLAIGRILHAIREHFANPYGFSERYRSSRDLPKFAPPPERKPLPPMLNIQAVELLRAKGLAIGRFQSALWGAIMICLGFAVFIEALPYPKSSPLLTSLLPAIAAAFAFYLILIGATLVADACLRDRKTFEFDRLVVELCVSISFFALGIAFATHAVSFTLIYVPGLTIVNEVKAYRQSL